METWIQNCLHRVQWTFHPHRKPGHRKNTILQSHGHHPRTPSSSSGMSILSSAELAAILTILQICPLYTIRIPHNHYKKPCATALLLINTCLHYSTILMLTCTTNSSTIELGEISYFSTSPTGIPHPTLLDYNSTCLTRKLGMPLENLQ